jgi:hypothetical protein
MVRGALGLCLVALLSSGCSSSGDDDDATTLSGQPLDCAWLHGDNCWKTTVRAAKSCVPPASETGTLTADGSSCSYASGTTVAFQTKLELPQPEFGQDDWDFVESQGTTACVEYHDHLDSDRALTVLGQAYREKSEGRALQVTCPDGSQYVAPDVTALLDCGDIDGNWQGYGTNPTDTSLSFSLPSGVGTDVQLFDCARP